jgi:hypothetical protein
VHHDGDPVGRHPHVELDGVGVGVDRRLEGLDRILRLLHRGATVRDDHRLGRALEVHAWLAGHSGSTGQIGHFGLFATQIARP